MSISKSKLELEFDIDPSEITHKGLQRMLRTALSQMRDRSQPLHKRGDDKAEELDADTEEADEENSKLVDLHQSRGTPAPIPVTDEDLPETVAEKLPMKKKKG
jgi:hypothetical protein